MEFNYFSEFFTTPTLGDGGSVLVFSNKEDGS
jgi:hypothetical protein